MTKISKFSRIAVVFLMVSIYFFSYFHRVAVPGTIFNELQHDFSATASAIAMLGAIVFYIYASTQVFTGLMVDRWGAGRILVIGGMVMALGAILFPLSHSMTFLYFSRILVGLGASLVFISMVKEIDELFDQHHFAMVLSVTLFLGYLGGLTGTYPLERAVSIIGWRKAFFAAGILSLLAIISVLYFLFRNNRLTTGNGNFSITRLKVVLVNRSGWPIMCCGSLCFALYFLMQTTIGKKLLQDCCSFSSAKAASFIFYMMLVNIIGATSSGFISHLFNDKRKPLLIGVSVLSIAWPILMVLILTKVLPPSYLLLSYVLSALSGCCSPIFCSIMKEANPSDCTGTSVGLINGVSYFAVAITISIAGAILDTFRNQAVIISDTIVYPNKAYIAIFVCAIVLALLSFVSSLFIKETNGRCIFEAVQKQ
jgi:sugar phosphate permease